MFTVLRNEHRVSFHAAGENTPSRTARVWNMSFALILVQLVMAMLARSAPALNLFAVGLPAALLAGLVLLAISAPVLADGMVTSLQAGLATAERIAGR